MNSKKYGPFKTKGELREVVTKGNHDFGAVVEYIASCFRYPVLWAVKEITEGNISWRRISFFDLTKEKGEWYASEERSEFSEDAPVSCPLGYIAMTSKGCGEWKIKVLHHHGQKELAREVKRIAKIKTVKVYLKSEGVPWAIVENTWPLEARYNGRLYKVMPKDIIKYEVLDNETHH
jgi:hypothetical protein